LSTAAWRQEHLVPNNRLRFPLVAQAARVAGAMKDTLLLGWVMLVVLPVLGLAWRPTAVWLCGSVPGMIIGWLWLLALILPFLVRP
jgi:hypothetical protein